MVILHRQEQTGTPQVVYSFTEGLDMAEAGEKSAVFHNPRKAVGPFFPGSAWTDPYITLPAHINM